MSEPIFSTFIGSVCIVGICYSICYQSDKIKKKYKQKTYLIFSNEEDDNHDNNINDNNIKKI